MSAKPKSVESAIKVYDSPQSMRVGGESRPFEYPHLYQIQAGDWRISYAVEHNRLAILVLEVLTPDGQVRKDPASEKLARRMKIKLLDWPEGSPSRDLPPEELGKKLKIKLLDLADDMTAEDSEARGRKGRIRLSAEPARKSGRARIKFPESPVAQDEDGSVDQPAAPDEAPGDRKVTPLDAPSL